MAALGGIETLVKSALNKLRKEYLDQSLAKIWIDFLTLYTTFFAPLPGFESRYFNEDRVNLIIKILTRRFDGQHKVPDPSQATAAAPKDHQAKLGEPGMVEAPPEPVIPEDSAEDSVEAAAAMNEEIAASVFEEMASNLNQPALLNEYSLDPPSAWPGKPKAPKPAKQPDEAESLEHQRQRTLCEHHKKAAFDMTRLIFEEELTAFEAMDATDAGLGELRFTKTCLQQNFFQCILEQLSELTRNSARKRVESR